MIKQYTFNDISKADNLQDFINEYAEYGIKALPTPCTDLNMYKVLEESGSLKIIGSFSGTTLTSLLTIVMYPSIHYGVKLAITESLFVPKRFRKSGIGLRLIRFAEQYAREHGASVLSITAPIHGELQTVLPRLGYTGASTVFVKTL